jgi:predicted enzyme related to lactoylglutathione lyase
VTPEMKTVIYPVKDVERAKTLYGALLGMAPTTDAPYYVGFTLPDLEFGLDPNGHAQGMTGPVSFWNVADIASTITQLVDAGAEVQQAPKDVGGGMLVARLSDSDGNPIGLIQRP